MDARERERRAREEIGNLHAQIDAQRAELEERWAGRREERGGAAAPEAARAVRPGGGVHDGAAAHGAMAVRVRDLEAQLNAARHKLSLADMENRCGAHLSLRSAACVEQGCGWGQERLV